LLELVYYYALLAVTWSLQRRGRRRHVTSWRHHVPTPACDQRRRNSVAARCPPREETTYAGLTVHTALRDGRLRCRVAGVTHSHTHTHTHTQWSWLE